MPVVYLPLASAEAFGQVGEVIVYQGVSVRKYVVPRDPRSGAQLDVRKLFFDINKVSKSMGDFLRAEARTKLGPRWHSVIYGHCKRDEGGFWSDAVTLWNGFSEVERDGWRSVAPYAATWNDPGFIFFAVQHVIYQIYIRDFGEALYWDDLLGDGYTFAGANWGKDMSGVVYAGLRDDDYGDFSYDSGWVTYSDAEAFGGSYKSIGSPHNGTIQVYFFGRQIKIHHLIGPTFGVGNVWIDDVNVGEINQYNVSAGHGVVWTSPVLERGLHRFYIHRIPSQLINVDAIEIIDRISVPRVPKPIGAVYDVGVMQFAEQTATPAAPSSEKSRLYFKTDNKLYRLADDGVEVEVGAGGLTQAEADLLYSALGHTHKQVLLIGSALEDGVLSAGGVASAKPFRSGIAFGGWNVALPVGGTLKNLYLRTGGAQPSSGSLVCTLNVNNSQKALVATCLAGSGAGSFSDLVNTCSIVPGDVVWFDLKNHATSNSAPLVSVVVVLEFDVS